MSAPPLFEPVRDGNDLPSVAVPGWRIASNDSWGNYSEEMMMEGLIQKARRYVATTRDIKAVGLVQSLIQRINALTEENIALKKKLNRDGDGRKG